MENCKKGEGMEKKRVSAEKRRNQIIEITMKLFSKKGFKGTTIKDIAKKASINESILYRHFKTKEKLYEAIINTACSEKEKPIISKELIDKTDDHVIFKDIALEIMNRLEKNQTFTRLFLFSSLEGYKLSDMFFKTRILKSFNNLADYLQKKMDDGAMKKMNPKLAARGFIGMLIYYILVQEIYGGKKIETFNNEEVADVFVGIFLKGMEKG